MKPGFGVRWVGRVLLISRDRGLGAAGGVFTPAGLHAAPRTRPAPGASGISRAPPDPAVPPSPRTHRLLSGGVSAWPGPRGCSLRSCSGERGDRPGVGSRRVEARRADTGQAGRRARSGGRGEVPEAPAGSRGPRRAPPRPAAGAPGTSGCRRSAGRTPGAPAREAPVPGRAHRSSPPAYFGEEGREGRAEPTPGESGDCAVMRPPPSCPRREGSRWPFSPSERAVPRLIPTPTLRD